MTLLRSSFGLKITPLGVATTTSYLVYMYVLTCIHLAMYLHTLVAYLSLLHLICVGFSTTLNPPITSSAVSPPPSAEIGSTKETKSLVDLKTKIVC